MTRASGDDGVDVIASKGAVTVAIQVKCWAKPVSKGAVQEVVAGRPVYRATHAAVISRSGYMPSTVRLAQANGVTLLHANHLLVIEGLLPPSVPHQRLNGRFRFGPFTKR